MDATDSFYSLKTRHIFLYADHKTEKTHLRKKKMRKRSAPNESSPKGKYAQPRSAKSSQKTSAKLLPSDRDTDQTPFDANSKPKSSETRDIAADKETRVRTSTSDFSPATMELEKQTEAQLRQFLVENNYTRQYGPGVCDNITDLRSLSVWVLESKHWYVLKGKAIENLIKLANQGGRSLCGIWMLNFFSMTNADYSKLKIRFALPNDNVGIYDDANGNYVMILELPDANRYDPTVVGLTAGGLLITAASLFAGYKARQNRRRSSKVVLKTNPT